MGLASGPFPSVTMTGANGDDQFHVITFTTTNLGTLTSVTVLLSLTGGKKQKIQLDATGVAPEPSSLVLFGMGLIGLTLGALLGSLLTLWFTFNGLTIPGMEDMAMQFNLPSRIYPVPTAMTVMLGPATVFAFTLVAAVYPALRLRRLQPVEAMRAA